MTYKVVPFTATIVKGQTHDAAAAQLEITINQHAEEGWEYVRLETVSTIVTTPADPGCLGIGATPASHIQTVFYMIVFRRPGAR
jgi:hypothetical protein